VSANLAFRSLTIIAVINPLKLNLPNYYTLAYIPFLISDILTFGHSGARMSEIKYGGLGLYGAKYSTCNHMMALGCKGLSH